METFNTEAFVATLALVGVVILLSGLLSGLIERSGLPQVAFFLALGAVLGPAGLNLLNINLESPIIRVVATLSLVLVLFNDAVALDIGEVRKQSKMALLLLGPGTLLSALLIGVAGWGLLGLAPAGAAILAAALASTDPVLLRPLLHRNEIPGSTRLALRLESGLNDVVLLPVVLVAMVFLEAKELNSLGWAKMLLDLFILGPGAGILVGLLAVATLDMVRRRIGVQRNYESLYAIGVAFTAFAAAEALHGSGFLAAFAAGMTISALDVELCDCFLEYGETTAEMLLLFTFVLFGGSIIWGGVANLTFALVFFAVLVLIIRPVVYMLALAPMKLSLKSRLIISWFGPRGLSSMLLVLLAVFADLPGSETLFYTCCLVVLFSVVLHGGSPFFILQMSKHKSNKSASSGGITGQSPSPVTVPASNGHERITDSLPLTFLPGKPHQPKPEEVQAVHEGEILTKRDDFGDDFEDHHATVPELITIEEMKELAQAQEPLIVLDVRAQRSYEISDLEAEGAIRISPEFPVKDAIQLNLPKNAWLIAFCA
jgi:NhaP-type Na+/H+ or K+/H+ antiporter